LVLAMTQPYDIGLLFIVAHCASISDLPGAAFAREIIAAYPEAKMTINTHSDTAAWHSSFDSTMGTFAKDSKNWEWSKNWLWYVRERVSERDTISVERSIMTELFRDASTLPGPNFQASSLARLPPMASGCTKSTLQ
jgi:hypothetical protein